MPDPPLNIRYHLPGIGLVTVPSSEVAGAQRFPASTAKSNQSQINRKTGASQ
jgi:hypothetical protein